MCKIEPLQWHLRTTTGHLPMEQHTTNFLTTHSVTAYIDRWEAWHRQMCSPMGNLNPAAAWNVTSEYWLSAQIRIAKFQLVPIPLPRVRERCDTLFELTKIGYASSQRAPICSWKLQLVNTVVITRPTWALKLIFSCHHLPFNQKGIFYFRCITISVLIIVAGHKLPVRL